MHNTKRKNINKKTQANNEHKRRQQYLKYRSDREAIQFLGKEYVEEEINNNKN